MQIFCLVKKPYDVIFCRNVLIYFDQPAREQTLQTLERLLQEEGLLFVGASETGPFFKSQFVAVRYPGAFAYRKTGEIVKSFSQPTVNKVKHQGKPVSRLRPDSAPVSLPLATAISLEEARQLADAGQLEEAATLCETYLSENRTSAAGYILLGQVQQAAGNNLLAEQSFQKAIYLAPDSCEALTHLALLKENRGDAAGVTLLWQRIQRLQESANQSFLKD